MADTYEFVDWSTTWETSKSRTYRALPWVSLQVTSMQTVRRRILAHPRGAEVLGIMVELVALASQMPVRGRLADQSGGLPVEEISVATGLSSEQIRLGLGVLSSPRIALLRRVDASGSPVADAPGPQLFAAESGQGQTKTATRPRRDPDETPAGPQQDPSGAATEPEHNGTEPLTESEDGVNSTARGDAPEAEPGETLGADSDSVQSSSLDFSDSDSLEQAASTGDRHRRQAWPMYVAAVQRVLGPRPTPGSPRSPQYAADLTTALSWWNEVIWAAEDPAEFGRTRLSQFLAGVSSSRTHANGTRMRYLTGVVKRIRAARANTRAREPAPA